MDMHRKRKRPLPESVLYTHVGTIGDEDEIESAFISIDYPINGHHIVLERCRIERPQIIYAPHIRMLKCSLTGVDAANANIEEAGWKDITVSESRFTGVRLNGSVLTDVTFVESRMDLIQIQNAKLKNVRFEQCDLRGAFFNGCSMSGTVFAGSNLTGIDFSGADINGSDLRRAIIEDIRIAPDQLTKVIVTSDQALYLARLFGLDVRE